MRFILLTVFFTIATGIYAKEPLKLAIAGLSHGHVDWIFNREDKGDVELVGIYETNTELIDRYVSRYQLDRTLIFTDLEEMLDQQHPDAVSAFGPINEHVVIVRACAPRGIHVMVEKPLATTFADAKEIAALAEKHDVQVLTNFETSWYESNQRVYNMLKQGQLGAIRKVMVNDGHQGPQEIGVSDEFFDMLTDPEKNGAGALVDFGCYGANLMTWLMKGERPVSVTAVTHQNKPQIYQRVDDEASIILQYPDAQCIIQASWNWPFSRKDMEVYGTQGYAIAPDATTLRFRETSESGEKTEKFGPRVAPYDDPFSLLAAVVDGSITLDEYDLYGLRINTIVVEILEAAIASARQGRTIILPAG